MWIAILASVGLVLGAANAEAGKYEEYGRYDVNKCLKTRRAPDGSTKYGIDLKDPKVRAEIIEGKKNQSLAGIGFVKFNEEAS